jgi:SAM-dependent methyltransferase
MSRLSVALPPAHWPRLHGVEWHEQPWVPEALRRGATDYLAATIELADPFAPLVPRLAELCARSGCDRFVDLCAGSGGPWLRLQRAVASALGRPVRVTLTDLYPNAAAFARLAAASDGAVAGVVAAVDARAVPERLGGIRTLFDCFHHFRPADARAVLADAHRRRQPIVIVEGTRRRLSALAGMLLAPLFVLLITPRIAPFSWTRLFYTYVLPILPLLILWDGVVSCLRSYRPAELRALTDGLDEGYRWEIGEYRRRGAVVTYLIGAVS